jgi:hypothetical protein
MKKDLRSMLVNQYWSPAVPALSVNSVRILAHHVLRSQPT